MKIQYVSIRTALLAERFRLNSKQAIELEKEFGQVRVEERERIAKILPAEVAIRASESIESEYNHPVQELLDYAIAIQGTTT